ncbi:MAG: Txe/YoeB family addiction module toxin [Clostridia bacterium]|nr:Txe/YoeB family addiction module toxin [Clostridia bacterium]
MNNLTFSPVAWDEYLYWQMQDKKTLKKINALLKDIGRSPFDGMGKPEPLRYCDGCWSRRIDEKNRLVYSVREDSDIIIISCKGHYED